MLAFWCGSAMVAVGVALHLPMFWMGRKTGFRLAGMPMDTGMLVGMALIILGIIAAAYGLLPRAASLSEPATNPSPRPRTRRSPRPIGYR